MQLKYFTFWRPIKDQKCQIIPFVFRFSNSYFFSSTCFFFPVMCQSTTCYLKQNISSWKSWNMSVTSDLGYWLSRSGKSAKSIKISRYSNSSFSKNTKLNSSIKVWIERGKILNVSYGSACDCILQIEMLISWTCGKDFF